MDVGPYNLGFKLTMLLLFLKSTFCVLTNTNHDIN